MTGIPTIPASDWNRTRGAVDRAINPGLASMGGRNIPVIARFVIASEGTNTVEARWPEGTATIPVAKPPCLAGAIGSYAAGETIWAMAYAHGGTGFDPVEWIDLNVDGRQAA